MLSNPSATVQVNLAHHNLLNQMKSCTKQLHEKKIYDTNTLHLRIQ